MSLSERCLLHGPRFHRIDLGELNLELERAVKEKVDAMRGGGSSVEEIVDMKIETSDYHKMVVILAREHNQLHRVNSKARITGALLSYHERISSHWRIIHHNRFLGKKGTNSEHL